MFREERIEGVEGEYRQGIWGERCPARQKSKKGLINRKGARIKTSFYD
jgi:hypothetical protein